MYTYTWYQWLLIFYAYCFFGWIFESAYVSLKNGHFVNRGFLRLPMLPLYGTGAVMMLWVSLPFQSNPLLVYISGLVAATVLEYVTGWAMERLFKMKYWDYSGQRFNLNGYICLSSSAAWGFLAILLTEVIHRPISRLILDLHVVPALITVGCVTVMFTLDAVQSVRTALDLAKVLDAMTRMRAELEDIQVQLILLKNETSQRVSEYKDGAALRLDLLKSEAALRAGTLGESTVSRMEDTAARFGELVEKLSSFTEDAASKVSNAILQRLESVQQAESEEQEKPGETSRREILYSLVERLNALAEKRRRLSSHIGFYHRSLLRGNPTATSSRFGDALKELRENAAKKLERKQD